jgi:hypothetical protein
VTVTNKIITALNISESFNRWSWSTRCKWCDHRLTEKQVNSLCSSCVGHKQLQESAETEFINQYRIRRKSFKQFIHQALNLSFNLVPIQFSEASQVIPAIEFPQDTLSEELTSIQTDFAVRLTRLTQNNRIYLHPKL